MTHKINHGPTTCLLITVLWGMFLGFPGGSVDKESACHAMQETQETQVLSLGLKDPLEQGMATHLSILAWRIPMDRGA